MAEPTTVAFLFVDLVRSTELLHQLGADDNATLNDGLFRTLRRTVERHEGLEIRSLGDGLAVAFPGAVGHCLSCAIDIQRDLQSFDRTSGSPGLELRVGVSVGEATRLEDGNWSGPAIVEAARLVDLADPGTILANDLVRRLVGPHTSFAFGPTSLRELKGFPHGLPCCDVLWRRDVDPGDCPYMGLLPYGERDADRFYGRDKEINVVLDRLSRSRFVAIVGASASGKSSLVRAGVIPALRRGALVSSEQWRVAIFQPAGSTLDELKSAITAAGHADGDTQVVLAIDQFEELYTNYDEPDGRQQFVDSLFAAIATNEQLRVVITLRSDFFGHAAQNPQLAEALESGTILLAPPRDEQLHDIVEGPARGAGLELAPGLADVIVRDAGEGRGSLALVSHALYETWRVGDGEALTLEAYRACGGARGAIARSADEVIASFSPTDAALAREIFLRVTALGEGAEDTSRRAPRTEIDGLVPAAPAVLERLVAARLVTADDETVELAHDALIREWPQLRRWIDADRERRRTLARLTRAAAEWHEAREDSADLWRGARLAGASEATSGALLTTSEREFLNASEASERDDEQQTRRQVRRLRMSLIGVGVALVIALIAGLVATRQRDRADTEADRARAASDTATVGQLVAESKVQQDHDRYLGALLAVEANDRRDDPDTEGALMSALLAEPRRVATLPTGPSTYVANIPHTSQLVVLRSDQVSLWDVTGGSGPVVLPVDEPSSAAVSPDGTRIVVGDRHGSLNFFDETGASSGPPIHVTNAPSYDLAFSPDGTRLAVALGIAGDPQKVSGDTSAQLIDLTNGVLTGAVLTGHGGTISAVAFSPDGREVATGGNDDRVILHDAVSGQPIGQPIGFDAQVTRIAFDPIRPHLAVATLAPGVQVFDTATHALIATELGNNSIGWLNYDATGDRLAVGGNGPVTLYDAGTFEPTEAPLDGQTGNARPAFAGANVAIAGGTGPVTVWDSDGQSPLIRLIPGAETYAFPMPGGQVIAAPDFADSVTLYDAKSLEPLGPPLTPSPGPKVRFLLPATFAASYYDGSRIAVVNRAGLLQQYAVPSGAKIGDPINLDMESSYAVFSRDMKTIAVGGRNGEIALVDVATQTWHTIKSVMTNYVLALEFGPSGELLAGDLGHLVVFTDLGQPEPTVRDLTNSLSEPAGAGADLSPDGNTIVVSQGNAVAFYDAHSLEPQGPPIPVSQLAPTWIAYSSDGRMVVADSGSEARLVDVAHHQVLGPPMMTAFASGAVFGEHALVLGTSVPPAQRGEPGRGAVMDLDLSTWRDEACTLAGRNLTQQEWDRYLPDDGPRQATCPQFPLD